MITARIIACIIIWIHGGRLTFSGGPAAGGMSCRAGGAGGTSQTVAGRRRGLETGLAADDGRRRGAGRQPLLEHRPLVAIVVRVVRRVVSVMCLIIVRAATCTRPTPHTPGPIILFVAANIMMIKYNYCPTVV